MKFLKYMTLTLMAGLLLYGTGAFAEETDIFKQAFNVTLSVFKNVRFIVYVIGGFGLIGVSVAAMMGKMQFKWLIYVCLGLAIVAAADLIVQFATSDARDYTPTISYEDVQNGLMEVGTTRVEKNEDGSSKETTKERMGDVEYVNTAYRAADGEIYD